MRNAVIGLAFSVAVAGLATPALAQSDEPHDRTPEELALEGIDRLMRALDLMIEAIPQYEAPVVDENGDIIIRRKNPAEDEDRIPRQKPEPPGSIPT